MWSSPCSDLSFQNYSFYICALFIFMYLHCSTFWKFIFPSVLSVTVQFYAIFGVFDRFAILTVVRKSIFCNGSSLQHLQLNEQKVNICFLFVLKFDCRRIYRLSGFPFSPAFTRNSSFCRFLCALASIFVTVCVHRSILYKIRTASNHQLLYLNQNSVNL